MAITIVNGSRAAGAVAAAGFDEPMNLATGASIARGNYLILVAAYDNSGTAGVDPNMFIADSAAVTATPGRDLRGNYWWRVAKAVRTSGVANDGSIADIWICKVNNAYSNGDNITAQFSFSQAAFVYRIFEVSGLRPYNYSIRTPQTSTGSNSTISIATGVLVPGTGCLFVGVAGWETNTAVTVDSDTTDGSWVTLNNSGYNSGTDATSQTLVSQAKILTGGSGQTWNLSKTGAADFAALVVLFQDLTTSPDTTPSGNTHYPCPAGPEILPVGDARVTVDTGTEYLFTWDLPPDYSGSATMAPITGVVLDSNLPSTSIQQHLIAADLYSEGAEEPIDQVESVVLYVSAAVGTGTTVIGGGTVPDAIANVGGAYVQIPPSAYIDVTFDPALLNTLFTGYRVMRIGVRYLAWKDDSSPAGPGEGMKVEWRDSYALGGPGGQFTAATAGSFSPGAFLVNNYQYQVGYELRWLGETNMLPRNKTSLNSFTASSGASFTVNDLSHMAAPNYEVGFRLTGMAGEDPLQTDIFLDYIELIVELAPERRTATGMRKVSSTLPSFYPAGINGSLWYDPSNTTNSAVVYSSSTKVMAIREALPPSPSDYYAAKTNESGGARSIGDTEAIGPSLFLGGVDVAWDSLADQPNIRRAQLSNGLIASPANELDRIFLAATPVDLMSYQLDGSIYPAYYISNPGTINDVSTLFPATQNIVVPGGQQYDAVKVLVHPDELTTANLTMNFIKGVTLATATITVADYEAAPKYGVWAELIVPLSVAITPTAGRVIVEFQSGATAAAPWSVSVGLSDSVIYAYDINDPDSQEYDFAVTLLCPLADPTYIVSTTSVSLQPTGEAQYHCAPETLANVPTITLTNADLYDYVTIQRIVGADVFDVAMITDPADDYLFTDYGCPWDLGSGEISYRIRGYRSTDHRIVESITPALLTAPSAPGALFGLATQDELFVYAPVSDAGQLEITYNPLNPISKVQLHGYNYQVALRSPEERGLSVSVPVLVDSLQCFAREFTTTNLAPETATKGQQAMSPTPFNPIRFLEGRDRLQLLLPGGNYRWVILDAGAMTVRTVNGTYVAEIELTDALGPSLMPWANSWEF